MLYSIAAVRHDYERVYLQVVVDGLWKCLMRIIIPRRVAYRKQGDVEKIAV